MSVWDAHHTYRDASQPATSQRPSRSASQPAGIADEVYTCLCFNVASFNFGIPQTMLESSKKWQGHAIKLGNLLLTIQTAAEADLLFGCEVGDHLQGFQTAGLSMDHIVDSKLGLGFKHEVEGAYITIWNTNVRLLNSDVFEVREVGRGSVMQWQLFVVTTDSGVSQPAASSGASQPAAQALLITGNLHIVVGSQQAVMPTRRKIVTACLTFLVQNVEIPPQYSDLPVARLLVGDCNMDSEQALHATQEVPPVHAKLRQFSVHTPSARLSGDVAFVQGALADIIEVPVGCSHTEKGMRNDCHDVVALQLKIPLLSVQSPPPPLPSYEAESTPETPWGSTVYVVAVQPALPSTLQGGASQPASQPGTVPVAEAPPAAPGTPKSSSASSDGSQAEYLDDSNVAADAETMHRHLQQLEGSEDLEEKVVERIGRILFKHRKVVVAGVTTTYMAPPEETRRCLRQLLARRKAYMDAWNLKDPGDASQLANGEGSSYLAGRYIFTEHARQEVMSSWKKEYAETPDQQERQLRDSWKPMPKKNKGKQKGGDKGKGNGKGKSDGKPEFGPNNEAVRRGMRSRFARHLQRVAGSKQLAEVIVFTGSTDPELLKETLGGASQPAASSGASQPAQPPAHEAPDYQAKKMAALRAKTRFRAGRLIDTRITKGHCWEADLSPQDRQLYEEYRTGESQRLMNLAVAEYSHGTLYAAGGRVVQIGGSTGGVTRKILDGWQPVDVANFLAT